MPLARPLEAAPANYLYPRATNPRDPDCLGPMINNTRPVWWECSFEWTKGAVKPWLGCCTKDVCATTDGKCPDPSEYYFMTTYTTSLPSSTPTPPPASSPTSIPATATADATSSNNNKDDGHNKTTTTTIAVASSVASVAGVIIIAFLVWFIMRRRKKARLAAAYPVAHDPNSFPPPVYDHAYPNPNDPHAAYGVGTAGHLPPPSARDSTGKRWSLFSGSGRGDDSSTMVSPLSPMTDKNPSSVVGNRMSELGGDNTFTPGLENVAELPAQSPTNTQR